MRKATPMDLTPDQVKALIKKLHPIMPVHTYGKSLSDFEGFVIDTLKSMRADETRRLTAVLYTLYRYADCAEEPHARDDDKISSMALQDVLDGPIIECQIRGPYEIP